MLRRRIDSSNSHSLTSLLPPSPLPQPNGERLILRIYNNGRNSKRVHFEHEILRQLNKVPLSFQVPHFLPTLEDPSKTNVLLSNGAEACLVEVIPGGLPKLTCVQDIGRASGELNTAIAKVDVTEAMCPTPPYYDLFAVHHAVTPELFYREIDGPAFDATRPYAIQMKKEIQEIQEKVASFSDLKLPYQLIHGDLVSQHYFLCSLESGQL